MRKGFLVTLALLALVQAGGTPPAALTNPPAHSLPLAASATAMPVPPPQAQPGHALPSRPPTETAPASVAAPTPWPAVLPPTPLEVPLRALAPARAGEFTLLGMR